MNTLLTVTLGYDLSLLDRLAASVDYPIQYKAVVANDNFKTVTEWNKAHKDWIGHCLWDNEGCAGGWNVTPKWFSSQDSWLITNDDQVFQPGALEVICREADAHQDAPIIHVNEHEAYDMFVWTKAGVDRLGLFDENFWPAYFEDYDYRNRIKAIGAKPYHIDKGLSIKHGRTKPAGQYYTKLLDEVKPINETYFNQKWASPPEDVRNWSFDIERRKRLKAIWNTHWKGSVYR